MAAEAAHPLKVLSVLLSYPAPPMAEAVRAIGPDDLAQFGRRREELGGLVARYRSATPGELQRAYVESFDFQKRSSLHLTYHVHGDRRQRGLALLRLKQAYGAAGLELAATELPDYLPLMLEFAAIAPEPAGRELLAEQRVAIELVRAALRDAGSEWAVALDAVADRLPGLTRRQLSRVRRLAAEGPPGEQVGLEPFAPPEVMPQDPGGPPPQPLVGEYR